MSCRDAAIIINAFQTDIGRITADDRTKVVDGKKIWRARNATRTDAAMENDDKIHQLGLTSLYFDGRKDRTCVDYSSATEVEEHVVVLAEPGSSYITHFTPRSGRAADLLRELYAVTVQFGGTVKVLGCDGTAVNTGTSGGVCRLFEIVTQSAVHWMVCQLHSNELNLRHLFMRLDGATSGPRSFSGPLGKACARDVSTREVVVFDAVPGHTDIIADNVLQQLSRDQEYLYLMTIAVQSGHVSERLARRRIGPLNHAR